MTGDQEQCTRYNLWYRVARPEPHGSDRGAESDETRPQVVCAQVTRTETASWWQISTWVRLGIEILSLGKYILPLDSARGGPTISVLAACTRSRNQPGGVHRRHGLPRRRRGQGRVHPQARGILGVKVDDKAGRRRRLHHDLHTQRRHDDRFPDRPRRHLRRGRVLVAWPDPERGKTPTSAPGSGSRRRLRRTRHHDHRTPRRRSAAVAPGQDEIGRRIPRWRRRHDQRRRRRLEVDAVSPLGSHQLQDGAISAARCGHRLAVADLEQQVGRFRHGGVEVAERRSVAGTSRCSSR